MTRLLLGHIWQAPRMLFSLTSGLLLGRLPLLSLFPHSPRNSSAPAGMGFTLSTKGPIPQPVGYLSKELDNVAKAWPGCLRALVATCLLIPEVPKLILGQSLTLFTPHDPGGLLTAKRGLWLSDNRLLKYQAQLLECPDVRLRVCSAINLAPLLPP
jgi:hypothetical protein